VIAGGRNKSVLLDVCAGKNIGTLLTANEKPIAACKQWLAGQLQLKGRLVFDAGAIKVLVKQGE
jgi:glutamate 5-kinase